MKNLYLICLFLIPIILNSTLLFSMEKFITLKDLATLAVIKQITNDFEYAKKISNNSIVPEELSDYIKYKIIEINKSFLIKVTVEKEKELICSQNGITAISINKTGNYAVIANTDTISLWNLKENICVKKFKEHESIITALAFDEEDTRIAVGYEDGTFCILCVINSNCVYKSNEHMLKIEQIQFNKECFFTADRYVLAQRCYDKGAIAQVSCYIHAFSGAAYYILPFNGQPMQKLIVCDKKTNKVLSIIDASPNDIYQAAISFDDSKVITSSIDSSEATLWNAKTGEILKNLDGHIDIVSVVTFSLDNKHALTVSNNGNSLQLKLWDSVTGELANDLIWPIDNISIPISIKIDSRNPDFCYVGFLDGTYAVINLNNSTMFLVDKLEQIGNTSYFIAILSEQNGGYLHNLQDTKGHSKYAEFNFDGKICNCMKLHEYDNIVTVLFGFSQGQCEVWRLIPKLSLKQLAILIKLKKIKDEGSKLLFDDFLVMVKDFNSNDEAFTSDQKKQLIRAALKIFDLKEIRELIAGFCIDK